MSSAPHPAPIRLLHLEDSALDHTIVRQTLRRAGLACELTRVESLDSFVQALQADRYDAILADYHLPGFTALEAWQALQSVTQPPPFIGR